MTTKKKTFYVYLIRDPRPGKRKVPVYVGKGKNQRAYTHLKKSHNRYLRRLIAKCRQEGHEPQIEFVEYFAIEADALAAETVLIAKYGRSNLDNGTLVNDTEGGEGVSGSFGLIACARKTIRKLNADPEFAKARDKRSSDRLRKQHADPVFAKDHSERMRKMNSDPAFKKAHSKRAAKAMRKLHADPDFAKARDERTRRMHADPVFAKARDERSRKAMRKLHADPDFAKANSKRCTKRMLKLHADPVFAKARDERARKQILKVNAARRAAKANGIGK